MIGVNSPAMFNLLSVVHIIDERIFWHFERTGRMPVSLTVSREEHDALIEWAKQLPYARKDITPETPMFTTYMGVMITIQ